MARPQKLSPEEKRTARANLLMTPAEYEGLTIMAQLKGATLNEFCCSLIAELIRKNAKVIESFKAEKSKHAAELNLAVD